jgi:hypothetical protein
MAFAMFWAGLLLHEAAHSVVAWVTSDNWTSPLLTPARGASAIAGPLLTLILVVGCAMFAGSVGRLRYVAAATAIGAASRLALIAVPTMLGKANDEKVVGLVFGVSPQAIWLTETLVTILLMSVVVRRSGISRRAAFLCCAAVCVGWISALTFGRAIGLPI